MVRYPDCCLCGQLKLNSIGELSETVIENVLLDFFYPRVREPGCLYHFTPVIDCGLGSIHSLVLCKYGQAGSSNALKEMYVLSGWKANWWAVMQLSEHIAAGHC